MGVGLIGALLEMLLLLHVKNMRLLSLLSCVMHLLLTLRWDGGLRIIALRSVLRKGQCLSSARKTLSYDARLGCITETKS